MRICFLTQTATDISAEYKKFFRNKDLFFVTFKQSNEQALAYVPKSTWSDGRNRLWEEVRGNYDYYVFIDDDLQFLRPRVGFSPQATYWAYKLLSLGHFARVYKPAEPNYFFKRLEHYLSAFQPEVLSVLELGNTGNFLDKETLKQNSYVRRMGWFDAQFTVFSEEAASKLLPYDSKISGWWSSQIPIYLYAHHVYGAKAISVSDIAVRNAYHVGEYVPNYDGHQDVKQMLAAISSATGKDFNSHYRNDSVVDIHYGQECILTQLPHPTDTEDYFTNYQASLKGLEKILHPHLAY
ncbi:MAG: hypothetical protein EOO61_19535 [Hymenobacter sp.]|nr:MAG: hypothetical protein EOO61_19535 [Hymenobacter sp.]